MKYLKIGMVLCALSALLPFRSEAQDATSETEVSAEMVRKDSLKSVQLAYRRVDKRDLPTDVSVVNVKELMESGYFTNSLAGMEAFVGGFHGNIWGMDSYLVLVDGVPRDAVNVNPTEIEQISFLKGVSAVALYGSRAAKGVVLITTKRGDLEAQRIKVRANTGIHIPKGYPKYMGSAEYMTLYNEARVNDGLEKLYNEEDIYHHAEGLNPYRYPDVDFFSSEYLKSFYTRTDVTAEVIGGGERARYYTNFGYANEGSLLDFGQAESHSGSNRFNVRGNIDVDINEVITSFINANAIFYTGKGVNSEYWESSDSLRPNRFAPLIPLDRLEADDAPSQTMINNSNHIIGGKYFLGGTQLNQTNPFADVYAGGTNKYNSRQFQFDAGINADLKGVLEGLSFQTMFAFDYSSTYNLAFENDYAVYEPIWNNYAGHDQIGSLIKYGVDAKTGDQNVDDSWYNQTLAFSSQLNYKRSMEDKHHVSAMLIASGFQQGEAGLYHKTANANLGLHVGYNLNHKYYAEFNGAVIHSARLPEGNRQAFNPTVSLAWRLSEEGFMEGVGFVDHLKLSASAGIIHTDLDIEEYYLYKGYYTHQDAEWHGWRDGFSRRMYDRRRGDNPYLKFPKREEVNMGLEASLFKQKLVFSSNFFVNRMTGNIVQTGVLYPSYFSTGWPEYSDIPYSNYNQDKRWGVDFQMEYRQRTGQVDWRLGVSGIYHETEALKRAENYSDAYQNRTGKPIDALWGLESNGFFPDQAAADALPRSSFGEVKPGDIRYVDQNKDGIIDSKDEIYLGKGGWSGAPLTMGVNLAAKWKSFTLSAVATGRFGAYGMKNSNYYWVFGDRKYSEVVRGRWTEASSDVATYPRLTTQGGDNNFRASDFWLYKADRFDLSRVQVSYDLPAPMLQNSRIKKLGVYVSGFNLLTVAPERDMMEMNVGAAPQTRFYNVGLKAEF